MRRDGPKVTVVGKTTALPVNCPSVMPRCGSLENVISTEEAGFFMNWVKPGEIRIADLGHDQ